MCYIKLHWTAFAHVLLHALTVRFCNIADCLDEFITPSKASSGRVCAAQRTRELAAWKALQVIRIAANQATVSAFRSSIGGRKRVLISTLQTSQFRNKCMIKSDINLYICIQDFNNSANPELATILLRSANSRGNAIFHLRK